MKGKDTRGYPYQSTVSAPCQMLIKERTGQTPAPGTPCPDYYYSADLVKIIAAVPEVCSFLPLDSSKVTRSCISPV